MQRWNWSKRNWNCIIINVSSMYICKFKSKILCKPFDFFSMTGTLMCVMWKKCGGGREWLLQPIPSSFLFDYHTPLVKISFSPQTSTTVKIKDGTCNFHQESAEHLLTLKLCLPCRLLKYLLNNLLHNMR